jgi:hypothetical protein
MNKKMFLALRREFNDPVFPTMKHLLLTFATILILANSFAQKTSEGYYITLETDTIAAKIKFKKGAYISEDIPNRIEVFEASGATKRFTPSDIKGFGVREDGNDYFFASKPSKGGDLKFLYAMYIGPKASLYKFSTFTPGSGYAMANNSIYLTFEKPGQEYLVALVRLTKPFKTKLREYFADDPEVVQLIDQRLKYFDKLDQDLLEIMVTANR